MGKNRDRRPQARKPRTRLGERLVTRGLETDTYNGGYQVRVQTPSTDE